MTPDRPRIAIVGFVPPTLTGQALATDRLADLLSSEFEISPVRLPGGGPERSGPSRARDAVAGMVHVLRWARVAEHDVTIWASLSDAPMGHFRDLFMSPVLDPERTVGWIHRGSMGASLHRPVLGGSLVRLLRSLSRTVFLEPALVPDTAFGLRTAVIPNVVPHGFAASPGEADHLRDARTRRLAELDRPVRALYVGLLMRTKGLELALQARHALSVRGRRMQLELVGPWASEGDRRVLEPIVCADAGVTCLGAIPSDEVRRRMDVADVLVFPSLLQEAQPLVILEAMSRGLPVVTLRRPSLVDVVGGSPGLIDATPDGIADAIEELTEPSANHSESLRLHRRFTQVYARSVVRRRWEEVLRNVVEREAS